MNLAAWQNDWLWGLPLIVLTIVIHVLGLGLIGVVVDRMANVVAKRGRAVAAFAVIMGVVALLVSVLHAIGGVAGPPPTTCLARCRTRGQR